MLIDPGRLRFLLAVARTGGVLAAADELRVSPSAVSQQLSRLERETGRQLVVRTARGTVLTEDGRAVAQAAEEVERTLNAALARLNEDESTVTGTIRVGTFQSFLRAVLAPSLAAWRATHPGIRFELVEADEVDLMRGLRAHELEMVISEHDIGEAPKKLAAGMTETPLLDEPWKLVVPKGTLTGGDPGDLSRLPLPWLGVDSLASIQAMRRITRAFADSPASVHRYMEATSALALVAVGEGAALIPSLALHGLALDHVDVLDVPGLGMRRIVLRRFERRTTSKAVALATSLIREAAGAFEDSAS